VEGVECRWGDDRPTERQTVALLGNLIRRKRLIVAVKHF
jgi:hypothetical protein